MRKLFDLTFDELNELLDDLNTQIFMQDRQIFELGWSFSCEFNECQEQILFGEVRVINSENNDLIYYEETDEYEPLKVYILRWFEGFKQQFSKITLV